ncbi:MAG: HEAT repeat domain-containing protein [Armatimonadetes bacterium]|nr:HEAT repeat domain-containing protein [Armatimonadota bacterium]MDE2205310.1 HEAT repeat domain-containing protein [Armatimonadota bacterium]
MRKHLNYLVFGAIVLIVATLAINHSRHMRYLVDSMSSPNPRVRSSAALELINSEQFMDAITGEPVHIRENAAGALRDLGTAAAVTQCIAFLKDDSGPVRTHLAHALAAIGANSPANITQLAKGLNDGDSYVRKGTIDALTNPQWGIGPRPGVAAGIVAEMKADAGSRGPAGDVLSSAVFETPAGRAQSVALLLAQLKDTDPAVRSGAADALGKIGDPSADPALIGLVQHDVASVVRVAIGALALIASPDGEPVLISAVANPNADSNAREQAAAGLGKLGDPAAITALLSALSDDDLDLRTAAVAALAHAVRPMPPAPAVQPVLKRLIAALANNNNDLRKGVASALVAVDSPSIDPALVVALKDPDPRVRAAAAVSLGFTGNAPAVPALIAALSDPDPTGNTPAAARDALAAIGTPALAPLTTETARGGVDAWYASQALAHMGVLALPALRREAANPDPTAQRWAAVALGGMGLADAKPTLEQLAQSSNADVQYVAREQLARLGATPN